jgi:Tfp pilus assembly pilus retraction ATPase PilT
MLREGALHQLPSAFQQGASVGCQTMDQSIMGLVQRRLVDRNEARLRLQDKALMP